MKTPVMLSKALRWIRWLGVLRCGLVGLALFGYYVEARAFQEYYALAYGDGWRELGPGLAIFVFGPLQLWAAISVVLRFLQHPSSSTAPSTPSTSTGAYGLDELTEKLARAERAGRAAMWLLGLPALVMVACVLDELLKLHLPSISLIAGPAALLWVPTWMGGLIAAVRAANEDGDSFWVKFSALYPVLTVLYAQL